MATHEATKHVDTTVTRYTKLYADSAGDSHFRDESVPLEEVEIAPPAAPLFRTEPVAAGETALVTMPAGWGRGDKPHVAFRRSIWFVLAGEIEIITSTGVARRFGPGDSILAEDLTGKGHTTEAVSPGGAQLVYATLTGRKAGRNPVS